MRMKARLQRKSRERERDGARESALVEKKRVKGNSVEREREIRR